MAQPEISGFDGKHRFLSNFWPAQVELDGMIYPSVEHAYQAAKTLNRFERETVRDAKTPGGAKRLGRLHAVREDWELIKVDVMRDLLRQKFEHPDLAEMLLQTQDALLIETNHWHDIFWGVCNNVGQNWLGRLLMQTREQLQLNRAILPGQNGN